jgi:hypothetical protein
MAVYNGEEFLPEAIESVLAQTLADFELIVIDDGSTDSTPQILASCAARDSRIVVHRQVNHGRAAALNRGVALTTAPLIARLDADDLAMPGRLERQREFLAEHESIAVVGGAVMFIDGNGRPFARWQYPLTDTEIRDALAYTTPIAHPAVMLRKDVFQAVGGYRSIFGDADDVDLWLRIAERHELANVRELAISYRVHPAQATVRNLELQTLCSVAARVAARARAQGRPDPLEGVERIDYEFLIDSGVTQGEITAALVRKTTWLAKMMSKAGYARAAEQLFGEARAMAWSASGSTELVAKVHREHARQYAEEGRRVRATLETAMGLLVQRHRRGARGPRPSR